MSQTDDFAPPNGPILNWGDPLPLDWKELPGARVSLSTNWFTTQHGTSLCSWRHDRLSRLYAYAAFHVPYSDGGCGVALLESDLVGMFPQTSNKIWRRRKKDGRTWWPGQLTIKKKSVEFEDAEQLLQLPTLSLRLIEELQQIELRDRPLKPHEIYWTELYQALACSQEFLEAVQDDGFAASAYSYFLRSNLVRERDGNLVIVGSERRYGDMLGALRRVGERYIDFYVGFEHGHKMSSPEDHAKLECMLREVGFIKAELSKRYLEIIATEQGQP